MRIRKTPPKEFTVDRSTWVHGEENSDILGEPLLLNVKGNMCCLGFYARACGATRGSINHQYYPGTDVPLMGEKSEIIPNAFVQSQFSTDAAEINDSGKMNKKEREKAIKEAFKEKGVKVKFTGRYPKGVV